ncbi:hypothetical protein J4407_01025 [Candidatus Pacearchaeota archaeon]|nr:hypothetical protein [Candidatus Pacearchaeota archaeon]
MIQRYCLNSKVFDYTLAIVMGTLLGAGIVISAIKNSQYNSAYVKEIESEKNYWVLGEVLKKILEKNIKDAR